MAFVCMCCIQMPLNTSQTEIFYFTVLFLNLHEHVIMLNRVAKAVINLFFDVTFVDLFLDLCTVHVSVRHIDG